MPKYPRASSAPRGRPNLSPEILRAQIQRMSPDPLVRQSLEFFFLTDAGDRIEAAAAKAVRQMNRSRDRGSSDFQHQVEDLVHQGWKVLLGEPRHFLSAGDFAETFIKTMNNHRDWRRKQSRKARLNNSPDAIDSPGVQAQIVRFPCPERQAADRYDLEFLQQAVRREAPDLEPLLTAIRLGETQPAEQAQALGLPITVIYAMRRRLKGLAARVLNWNE